jgi:hypothetical protein
LADLYIIRPDGGGLKKIGVSGNSCGSAKWVAGSRRVVTYCMTGEQTLTNRMAHIDGGNENRTVFNRRDHECVDHARRRSWCEKDKANGAAASTI